MKDIKNTIISIIFWIFVWQLWDIFIEKLKLTDLQLTIISIVGITVILRGDTKYIV